MNPLYHHFAHVISHGPATDCRDTIRMVMKLSGGKTDPNMVAEWWNQWQTLRQAMKDNHPMVKLAAALAPVDPPVKGKSASQVIVDDIAPHPQSDAVFRAQTEDAPKSKRCPRHPREYRHHSSRMVRVPVKIHWNYQGRNGIADYEAIAMVEDERGRFELSEFYWSEGNFGCDCNRSVACGLVKDNDHTLPCGDQVRITRVESLDPLIPSLELNEPPAVALADSDPSAN